MAAKSVEWEEVAQGVYLAEANDKALKVWVIGGQWFASVDGRSTTNPGAYYEDSASAKTDAQRWAYLV